MNLKTYCAAALLIVPSCSGGGSEVDRGAAGAGGSTTAGSTSGGHPDVGGSEQAAGGATSEGGSANQGDAIREAGVDGALATGSGGGSNGGGAPITADGRFQVTPWAVYGPDGNEWRGVSQSVSAQGMWWSGAAIGDDHPLVDCWKSNTIDACGRVVNPSALKNDSWDAIIAHYTAKKMVVVVTTVDNPAANWSDAAYNSANGAYHQWLRSMAQKYKDNPYVWFDIVGENGAWADCNEQNYVTAVQDIVRTMRSTGANNIIAVLGNAWGQDAAATSGLTVTSRSCHLAFGKDVRYFDGKDYAGDGIIYEIHPYETWDTDAYARLDDYIDRNQARGQYVRLDDQADANGSTGTCANTLAAVYRIARERRLTLGGPWYWTGDGSAGATRDHLVGNASGSAISDCSNPTNLTSMGTLIWNDAHLDYSKLPNHVRSPTPSHSATAVDLGVKLSWDAATGATSYDVYFGTDETPDDSELKGNQTATTYDPGPLVAGTTYYWRVSPKNAAGTIRGGVMTFTTR